MFSLLNRNSALLAASWLVINLIGLLYIFILRPLKLDGEILNLINEQGSSSPISLGQEILLAHSKEIKFGFEELSLNEIDEFKLAIKKDLPELEEHQKINKDNLKTIISSAWPYLLNDDSLKQFQDGNIEAISKRLEKLLKGPDSYFYSYFIKEDPLLIASSRLQALLSNQTNNTGKVITYKTKQVGDDNSLVNRIDLKTKEFKNKHPKGKVHWSGYIKFKTSSANKIKTDIQFVSTISSILIPLILIIYFRSLKAPLLSLLSSLSGMLFGAILVSATKDSLHLITLAFGSSLVGASVDYAIHYQSENVGNPHKSLEELRQITLPSLIIGALTSIIAFIGLSFSHFPGLKELSIFSIGSLIASLICTVLWYPYLSVQVDSKLTEQNKNLFNLARRTKLPIIAPLVIGLLITFSLFTINLDTPLFQDDISALQSPDKNLIDDEIWFKSQDESSAYSDLLFINSKSLDRDLLTIGKKLNAPLLGVLANEEEAKTSKETLQKFLNLNKEKLTEKLKEIGYSKLLFDSIFAPSQKSYQESISLITENFKIRESVGFIPIHSQDLEKINTLEKSKPEINLEPYNHRERISSMFKEFRIESIYLVSISYLVIFLFLAYRYGISRGLIALIPSLLSLTSSIILIHALGIPLSFFGILAFVIVLGLSIDYSVFYMEDSDNNLGAKLSIFLCTLTTIITFGALSMSETESLKNFGIVISLGVFFTAVYTNLIFSKNK